MPKTYTLKGKHASFHYLLTIILALIKAGVFSLIWLIVALLGWGIFRVRYTPFDILIGLPLLLIGGGFIVHSLWSFLLSIFSPSYNKGACILCRNHKNHRQYKQVVGR